MVSGSWGTWKDEVRAQELLNLPVRLTSVCDTAAKRLVREVDEASPHGSSEEREY